MVLGHTEPPGGRAPGPVEPAAESDTNAGPGLVPRLLPFAPLLLVAALLVGLGRPPLWRDEVASVVAASRNGSALWNLLLHSSDASTGLYYVLLAPVVRLVQQPWVLRLPSLIGAGIAVAVTIDTVRRLAGGRPAFLAGVLLAGNALVVSLAGMARPYTLAMAAAACATRLLLTTRSERTRSAVAYGFWVVVAVYLQAMTALVFLAQGLALASFRRFAPIRRSFMLALGAAALAVVPLAVLLRAQSVQVAWLPLVSSVGQVGEAAEQVAGGTSGPSRAWGLAVVAGVVLAVVFRSRVAPGLIGPLGLMAALPPAILVALGTVVPVFADRYLVFALPPLAVLAALGWATVARPLAVLAGATLSGVAVAVTVGWIGAATAPDDPDAAAAFIATHDAPGDVIVYSPVWARTEIHYFLERRDDVAARDVGLRPGTVEAEVPSLYLPETGAGSVRSALLGARRIWVVGFPGSTWRPTTNTSADVYAALPPSGRVLLDRWFGDLHVQLVERTP